jgi:transcriptional regulator with XRE-family HTH domain
MKSDDALTSLVLNPIKVAMNLKNQLRFYIDHRELSATQLSKKAGVPKQSLSGWLAGSNPRDVRQVKRVADALGITLDNLMFGSGEDPSRATANALETLLGDEWVGGLFEIRVRRVKKGK